MEASKLGGHRLGGNLGTEAVSRVVDGAQVLEENVSGFLGNLRSQRRE